MVTAPEQVKEREEQENNNKSQLYRLFVIGKKSLPEIRKTEARSSERIVPLKTIALYIIPPGCSALSDAIWSGLSSAIKVTCFILVVGMIVVAFCA
jgi:hypothetical protein